MLGRVSVLFSTLEAELGELLCALLDQEEPLLAATVLEHTTFARTLDLLEKVARFKDTVVEARITRLLAIIKPLRKRRNLFIHGYWDISTKFLSQGKVAVSDSKIEFTRMENRKTWRKGTNHTLAYQDLQEYQTEVMRALKMTKELLQTLEDNC
jgi:hypothetical protein